MTVSITTEHGATLDSAIADDVRAGVQLMGVDDANIILTGDLARSVREATGNSSYALDRSGGVVAGKTVDGTTSYLSADAVMEERAAVTALAAHEAGHLLLHRRGEGFDEGRTSPSSDARVWEVGSARCALDEFRITLALHAENLGCTPRSFTDDVPHHLFEVGVDVLEALNDHWPSDTNRGDLYAAAMRILPVVQNLGKVLSYSAAEVSAGDRELLPDTFSPPVRALWEEFASSTWDDRSQLLEQMPDARLPLAVGQLESGIRELADIEARLLAAIGFRLKWGAQGELDIFMTRTDWPTVFEAVLEIDDAIEDGSASPPGS
ncbi:MULTISPECIES: hypothetical protein [Mumia]|uniref:hypothetical protein n=1 Tax=Mumia TaxID=1546255 RepID=UPI001421D6A4|nr:hypothetical protein [Mumia sp. ZJ430]